MSDYITGLVRIVLPNAMNDKPGYSKRWRAELWLNPFSGECKGATRWVYSPAQARRDGNSYLKVGRWIK